MATVAKPPQNTGTDVNANHPQNTSPKKEELLKRILTVDVKTLLSHLKDENFNNTNTLIEIFPKIQRVTPQSRSTRLYLKNLGSSHTIGAVFYGDMRPFNIGDVVRCVGHLDGTSGQFKISKMSKIDISDESPLIDRLIAICNFEQAKIPLKASNNAQK